MAGNIFKTGSFLSRTARLLAKKSHFSKTYVSSSCIRYCNPNNQTSKHDSSKLKVKEEDRNCVSSDVEVPNDTALAVGTERYELLAAQYNDDDPWGNKPTQGKGSKTDPIKIPSLFGKRIVGCVCDEDSVEVIWITVERGKPTNCPCGDTWYMIEDDMTPVVQPSS